MTDNKTAIKHSEKIVCDVGQICLPNGDVKVILEKVESQDERDSREKLEESVYRFYECNDLNALHYSDFLDMVCKWLDRQAAITESSICENCALQYGANVDMESRLNELQAKVYELVDENSRLRSCLSDDAENAKLILGENAELRAKLDALEAERDELQAELDVKQGALDIAVKNESSLEQRIIELEKENDRLMQKVADAKVEADATVGTHSITHLTTDSSVSDTLTVEQVREAIYSGSTYTTYDGTRFHATGIDMQAITDKLNAILGSERELVDLAHNAWSMALCAMQGMPIPAEWGDAVERGLRKHGINVDEEKVISGER